MKFKEDSAYIDLILAGDRHAFGLLVQKHQAFAFTLAVRITKNEEDAKEVAQDSFIKIYHSLAQFERKSAFKTWLYKINYHEALGKLRQNQRQFLRVDELDSEGMEFCDFETGLEAMQRAERSKMIQEALDRIKPAEAAILTLYYLEEQCIKEIQEITSYSESNIKILLHRGRKNLMVEISKAMENEKVNIS